MSAGMPWVKLYTEMLDDPKFGRLPESSQLLFVKLLLLAGDCDGEGQVPLSREAIAWRLRLDPGPLASALLPLLSAGMVEDYGDEGLFIVKFADRQERPQSEKREQWRERQRESRARRETVTRDTPESHAGVTPLEERRGEESRVEEEEEGEASSAASAVTEAYFQAFGVHNQLDAQLLEHALEEYPPGWIVAAITEAVAHNKRSWRYAEKILERWKREGRDNGGASPAGHTPSVLAAERRAAELAAQRGGVDVPA